MRLCSFAQQSTRYVEDDDIEMITPNWIQTKINESKSLSVFDIEFIYYYILHLITIFYKRLRNERNWKKEEAREILPNSLKTEIVVKATLDEWKHIFKLRTAKDAHSEMRRIMIPIQEEFKRLGYIK